MTILLLLAGSKNARRCKTCHECGTTRSTQTARWHSGPQEHRVLCYECGARYKEHGSLPALPALPAGLSPLPGAALAAHSTPPGPVLTPMQAAMSREAAGDEDIAESGEVASPASPAGAPSHGTIIECQPTPSISARTTRAARAHWAALQRLAPALAFSNGAICSSMSYSGQRTPMSDQDNAALSAQVNLLYNPLPARKSLSMCVGV